MESTAGAGLLVGLSPLIGAPKVKKHERRTLFFNLANEDWEGKKYFYQIGGKFHQLKRVRDDPGVLARERWDNKFLSLIPDHQITHHLEDAAFDTAIATLGYIGAPIANSPGQWSMSKIVQQFPNASVAEAYRRARAITAEGPLPLSAKRQRYNIAAAESERDLMEEQAFLDSSDHARTLIALHPDLLCAEPNSAQHIATSHISNSSSTLFLAGLLESQGPALPEVTPGAPNGQGWATLRPINQDNGQPFQNTKKLNQYFPDWNSEVDGLVKGAVIAIHPAVKNDLTLGADITGVAPTVDTPNDALAGKIWYRHDGIGPLNANGGTLVRGSTLQWTFAQQNGEIGLFVSEPEVVQSGATVQITLNNVANWFLRFLGMWLQFKSPDGVIPVSALPNDTIPSRNGQPNALDKPDALFAGIVSPAFSIAGIPVAPGQLSVTLNVPPDCETIEVFYAGLGGSGSPVGPNQIIPVGLGLTIAVNYGLVAFFMAVGVSTIDPVIKLIAGLAGQVIAQELITLIGADVLDGGAGIPLIPTALAIIKGILNGLSGKALTALTGVILGEMLASELIDSIPVAGEIARAVAAVTGGVQLAETSIEVGISPPVYEFDLVLTHDLTVTILPDVNNSQFPQPPAGYTLYYKLNYLFDSSTPQVLDAVDVDPSQKSIVRTLPGFPRGGKVNVSAGFYMRKTSTPAGQNDWCAGKGSSGLVDNDVDAVPPFNIEQIKIPIRGDTQYLHTFKTTLDGSGNRLWLATGEAPAYNPLDSGQRDGDLAQLRSITVRQGTSNQAGYLGYSWQSYSSALSGCTVNGAGQFDQVANIGTATGGSGSGAQDGYARILCALQNGGAKTGANIAYSLLTSSASNFYLDTDSLLVRQVQLDPPMFSEPGSGQAFAQLNLDSTRLLLHPAGHLVSISNAYHKLETARLPDAPMNDSDATANLLARTCAGFGTRPGLMKSPVAAAVTPEGVVLVLEDSAFNNRIQAFDLGGNPVQYFKQQKMSPYYLTPNATEGATYLDLAVEFTGYIYVLSQDPNSLMFRLDIYHPTQTDGKPISTTRGVTAARLCVDFWRSVYTLNYEVLQLPNGGGYNGITEPSVSLWEPPPPAQ